MTFNKAIMARPTDLPIGRTARGDEIRIIARSLDTDGSIGMFGAWVEPDTGPDWHTHSRETEVFHVISGTFRFWCGDDCFDGGPGVTVTLPPHVPHQWKNIGDTPGQIMTIVTPGGFEEHLIEIAALDVVTDEAIAALDARYGIVDGYPGNNPPA
jgi:mannose-6-phosphate isomerase-like protein (cupin superfamily)